MTKGFVYVHFEQKKNQLHTYTCISCTSAYAHLQQTEEKHVVTYVTVKLKPVFGDLFHGAVTTAVFPSKTNNS